MELFLKMEGIEVQKSEPHVHQQNGHVEHINHTLMEKSEAMRHHACCPDSWWEFSYSTAMHIYNCTPMCRLNWKTPNEIFLWNKPDVSYFRTFGCGAYVFIPKGQCKNKQSPHSEAMIFIGYNQGSKGFLFMRNNNTIYHGAQATFFETWFPHCKSTESGEGSKPNKPVQSNPKNPDFS